MLVGKPRSVKSWMIFFAPAGAVTVSGLSLGAMLTLKLPLVALASAEVTLPVSVKVLVFVLRVICIEVLVALLPLPSWNDRPNGKVSPPV